MQKIAITIVFLMPLMVWAVVGSSGESADQALFEQACSQDESLAAEAIEKIRARGAEGMDAFLAQYKQEFTSRNRNEIMELHSVLDRIAGQKDSYYSGLFWYTDLESAKSVAEDQDKPILSLRMLGNLTDDLSCANSRLFRAVLYANKEVSAYLRKHFVLHWSSERPVPVVTIDYGDGRVMKRTITGNSIHYVLDAKGRPLDGIPGLYSPDGFLDQLAKALELHKELGSLEGQKRMNHLQKWHEERIAFIDKAARAGGIQTGVQLDTNSFSSARMAEMLTVGKMAVEMPVLSSISDLSPYAVEPWRDEINPIDENALAWDQVAAYFNYTCLVDVGTRELIRLKNPDKYLRPGLLQTDIWALNQRTSVESARNEVILHRPIHSYFLNGMVGDDLMAMNTMIYSELFRTPKSDPWLGLLPPDVYIGLDGDGIVRE